MALPNTILTKTLNIKNFTITKAEFFTKTISRCGESFQQKSLAIYGKLYKKEQCRCPVCMTKCPKYDHKRETESEWRLPNLNGVYVYIRYRPWRIQCKEHGILTEHIPFADRNSRFSIDFNNEAAWLSTQMSKSAVSLYLGINWRTVGNCVGAAHSRLEPDVTERLHCGLKRICIDETSYKKGHSYITVVYDMDRNRVVWISEKHGESVFEQFCLALTEEERDAITVVAGDGARWIDSCTKKYFKNAKRCVDFFHVTEWANTAVDKARIETASLASKELSRKKKEFEKEEAKVKADLEEKQSKLDEAVKEYQSLPKKGRPSARKKELKAYIDELSSLLNTARQEGEVSVGRGRPRKEQFNPEHQAVVDDLAKTVSKIKGAKYALGKNPENRTENQDDMVELISNSFPELYEAYQQKEELRIILHMKDAELAKEKLSEWIEKTRISKTNGMVELGEKINRHKENILNAIENQANSAQSEATNTTIKSLIKMARGFRNIENLISLVYLKCSDIVIPLNNRYQPDAQKEAQMRQRAKELKQAREAKKAGKKATLSA